MCNVVCNIASRFRCASLFHPLPCKILIVVIIQEFITIVNMVKFCETLFQHLSILQNIISITKLKKRNLTETTSFTKSASKLRYLRQEKYWLIQLTKRTALSCA